MKKHILLVIVVVLLGALLTGCDSNKITNESKPNDIGNDNSTVVWKECHNDYFSLKYPAEWNIELEESDELSEAYFSPEKILMKDEELKEIPEVFFYVVFDIVNKENPGSKMSEDEFYAEMERDLIWMKEDGDIITDHRRTTIDGRPAYRYESIIPASDDFLSYDAKAVDIEIYNEYNTFDIGFISIIDKYDANIGIAEEMFKSFKW